MGNVTTLGAYLDIDAASVAVGTSAVLLTTGMTGRRSIYIFNNAAAGGATLFVGGSDVITGGIGQANSGMPVPPQTSLSIDASAAIGGSPTQPGATAGIWGISTAVIDVRVLEVS